MSYKTNILKTLREDTDDSITVSSGSEELKDTITGVDDAIKNDSSLKGRLNVDITAESEDLEEGREGTTSDGIPLRVGMRIRFVYDSHTYDGEISDIHDGRATIMSNAGQGAAIPMSLMNSSNTKLDANEGLKETGDSQDVEVNADNYFAQKNVADLAAASMEGGVEPLSGVDMKQFYDKKVKHKTNGLVGDVVRWGASKLKVKITDGEHIGKLFTAYPEEVEIVESTVVGRMSKGKLEKLVEQNKNIGKAYKKIIKVSEIRSKNG